MIRLNNTGVAPRLLDFDAEQRMLVMEDAGKKLHHMLDVMVFLARVVRTCSSGLHAHIYMYVAQLCMCMYVRLCICAWMCVCPLACVCACVRVRGWLNARVHASMRARVGGVVCGWGD